MAPHHIFRIAWNKQGITNLSCSRHEQINILLKIVGPMPWYLPICKSTAIAKEIQCLKFQSLKIQFGKIQCQMVKFTKSANPMSKLQCQVVKSKFQVYNKIHNSNVKYQ